MPELNIQDVPAELYQRLKESAEKNHRSLTKEALAIIEASLYTMPSLSRELPEPLRGNYQLTDDFLKRSISEGRD